jgi:hypothetical protein
MDSFEIRKNGELVETIIAHEFKLRGKNTAVFSLYGQPETVIVLEPGMRVDRVCEPVPERNINAIVERHLERMKHADKGKDEPPSSVVEFPR